MAVKVFNRIGLRRDFNLSDLINPESALNNILRTDSMSDGDPFTVEDIAPIKNIYVTDITASTFLTLDGIMVEFTQILTDPLTGLPQVDNSDNPVPYKPYVKIKNRLDTVYFTTGEPFFFGGDGPIATYYDAANIIREPDDLVTNKVYQIGDVVLSNNNIYRVVSPNSITTTVLSHGSGIQDGFLFERVYDNKEVFFNGTYDVITGEERTESDNFWERGFFLYGDKIRDSYLSTLGGVKWNGYFKPTVSGTHRFQIRSSGNCQFRFQAPEVLSAVETKYGQPNTTFVTNYITNNPGLTSNQQAWINAFISILGDSTRKFVEVRLQTALTLATDDILYIDSLQGQLRSKQYRIFTLRPTGEQWTVDRLWVEVTADFNRKNVLISDLPNFGTDVWANADGNRSFIRYYPYQRRGLKTYLNSIYKNLVLPSGSFTTSANTITFTGANADLYYYQFMQNDYIYDYRLRSSDLDENSDVQQGVRRYKVTALSDSTKTVTLVLDNEYIGISTKSNNDQQARFDAPDLYVFTEDFGGLPPFGELITKIYSTGDLDDTISTDTLTNNLHFVARFGEAGNQIREKRITIDQFIPKYEEHAFEASFFMKDEDIEFQNEVDEKGIIFWYADENSGYDPVSYKHFYEPNYQFFQIGDFKTFLDNTIGFGGTSRETGIDQRTFGKPQLLSAGDQYKTFYTTLPVQSQYTPKVKWNDVTTVSSSAVGSSTRKLSISDVVEIEVGNYIVPENVTSFSGTETVIPRGTRVIEVLQNTTSSNGDAILNKVTLQSAGATSFVYFNHRGFVTPLLLKAKGNSSTPRIFFSNDLPISTCKFAHSNVQIYEVSTGGTETLIRTYSNTAAIGSSGSSSVGGVNFTYTTDTNGITFTGPGVGLVFAYENGDNDSYMDGVSSGMVFVSNRDPSNQTVYRRVQGYIDTNDDGKGYIFFNNNYTDMTGGDAFAAIYYDKGIDIVKPLESYCNGIACNQNAYQTQVVTNDDGESEIVTFNDTKYIAPLLSQANDTSLDTTTQAWPGSSTITMAESATDVVVHWFDRLNQRNDDYEPTESTNSLYKDDVVHIQLSSDDPIKSAISEKGFPNTAGLTGANDYIPIGRIIGYIKVRRGSNYEYRYIVRVNPKAYTWVDTENDSNGNPLSKKIDWTKFNTSDYWISKWSVKNGSSRISFAGNITGKTPLINYQNVWVGGSTGTAEQYCKVTSAIVLTSAEASTNFHNPNSIPVSGTTNRELPANSFIRRADIDGVKKLIYFSEFSEFQGAYSVYGKHYTGTDPANGMNVTNNFSNDNQKTHTIINLQNQKFNDAKRISLSDDPFDYVQFRGKVYELSDGNSQVENIIPFVRFINPFGTGTDVQTRIQNTMNPLTVYTFTNNTTNRELCCPPLDTSPPFDSSPIGLSTTINEPDMSVAGGLNVRNISANHPVADIYDIPEGVTISDLDVDKKLRIDFGGAKYDLLIGDNIPQAVIDGN